MKELGIPRPPLTGAAPWFVGKYGFTLASPVLYEKPIPCKGRLGFFVPDFKEVK